MRLIRYIKIIIFIILITIISSQQVKANDVSLVVSPPRVDLEGKPGETLQQIIKVTNNSDKSELILRAFPVDFIVTDNQGTPVKVDEAASGRYLASPWFTLDQQELVVAPKATTTLIVLITIPKDALPGGHYAGVFFRPVPSRGFKQTVSYTSSEVGSLFGITVPGDIKYDALIKDFSVQNTLSEFGPVEFSATIENQSDTHIHPSTNIVIHDMIGRQLADLKLDEVNIFPYAARTLQSTWDTVWGFGRYTATLTATYGPGLTANRTIYFWIIPYRLLAAILIIILVILTLFLLIRRHLKSREDHRDAEIDELKRKIIEMENKSR